MLGVKYTLLPHPFCPGLPISFTAAIMSVTNAPVGLLLHNFDFLTDLLLKRKDAGKTIGKHR